MASPSPSDTPTSHGDGIGGRRSHLGFMANAMKRKESFVQLFLMTGILMLSLRSLGQKYRIHDLSNDNALLREERDSLAIRSASVKDALLREAALDPSGGLAEQLRNLFKSLP